MLSSQLYVLLKNIYLNFCVCTNTWTLMHSCAYAHMCTCFVAVPEEDGVEIFEPGIRGAVGCLMWVLGTKFKSSERTAITLNYGVISQSHPL